MSTTVIIHSLGALQPDEVAHHAPRHDPTAETERVSEYCECSKVMQNRALPKPCKTAHIRKSHIS